MFLLQLKNILWGNSCRICQSPTSINLFLSCNIDFLKFPDFPNFLSLAWSSFYLILTWINAPASIHSAPSPSRQLKSQECTHITSRAGPQTDSHKWRGNQDHPSSMWKQQCRLRGSELAAESCIAFLVSSAQKIMIQCYIEFYIKIPIFYSLKNSFRRVIYIWQQ